ncbi:MAG TPA: ABC transporter permease [Symbiobacteriaceae bacterium]
MMDFFQYLVRISPTLLQRASEHLAMTANAVGLALVVGVPLGVLIARRPWLSHWVLGLCNTIQTIPILAFVGMLIPLTGLGTTTAVITLFAYSLLPIIQNTCTGLKQVDSGIIEAARGMGMTRMQILRLVQLPLALPVMVTGIRIATVMTLGSASIMSLAGAGGLGQIIFTGISRVNDQMVLAGALPAALLAVLADVSLGWLEKKLTPRGVRLEPVRASRTAAALEQETAAAAS